MTVQAKDELLYNGEEYRISKEPLKPYLEKNMIEFDATSTACKRGYVATWLIDDDKLFMIDLSASIQISRLPYKFKEVGMDYLFPNQDEVFAEWFSGEISLPHGKPILGYWNVFEESLILKFVSGKLVDSHIEDNTHQYCNKVVDEKDDLPF